MNALMKLFDSVWVIIDGLKLSVLAVNLTTHGVVLRGHSRKSAGWTLCTAPTSNALKKGKAIQLQGLDRPRGFQYFNPLNRKRRLLYLKTQLNVKLLVHHVTGRL